MVSSVLPYIPYFLLESPQLDNLYKNYLKICRSMGYVRFKVIPMGMGPLILLLNLQATGSVAILLKQLLKYLSKDLEIYYIYYTLYI
uniref:Uncharacterized protein n=1 Tax=Arundo donax TaxID=35708 RepID=A0A0A9A393_ARUDO